MDVTTVAITLGGIGIGCACAALGALVTRWISEREIRTLRSANRSERKELECQRDNICKEFEMYRGSVLDIIDEKDSKIRELRAENSKLRSDLKGAELRVEIHNKMMSKMMRG